MSQRVQPRWAKIGGVTLRARENSRQTSNNMASEHPAQEKGIQTLVVDKVLTFCENSWVWREFSRRARGPG